MAQPVRTCIGCRQRQGRHRLLRFVADPRGRLVVDPLQRARGRGVYACPSAGCIKEAVRRAGFARGLRRNLAHIEATGLTLASRQAIEAEIRRLVQVGLTDGRARLAGDGRARINRRPGDAERVEHRAPGDLEALRLPPGDVQVLVAKDAFGTRLACLLQQLSRLQAEGQDRPDPPQEGSRK